MLEHVVVAEELLGRHLLDGETVHHRNGVVRDDFRSENLELWTRPNPAGIRVGDALAWAGGIFERYGEGGGIRTDRSANAKVDVGAVYVL